ncbi:MAG: SulP family inorganic anion transporter [Planctomycetes bacterium]|nr:SulP family inorganic anion transporter [Planctomycetota bacterium]
MFFLFKRKQGNTKDDLLSGLTVSLALVPEAVAFSFVAGVDPLVGLYAAFIVGLVTSIFGGRPGMISGATGALAVVLTALVAQYGVEYLFAAVVMMGVLQVLAGVFRLGKFVRLIPHPVMLGFVNGLAIVIFLAQMGQFKKVDAEATQALLDSAPDAAPVLMWLQGPELYLMLGLTALTMLIINFLPKLTKAVPASLAAILAVTLITQFIDFGIPVRTVFDQLQSMLPPDTDPAMISLSGGLPSFHVPAISLSMDSLLIIAPYAIILALVGLIESLMTLSLIDEITETRGRSNRECMAQGAANVITGFFGGMGGCAMIGQSMINIRAGGRGRLSGITAAVCLLLIILVAAPLIEKIPLAALTGVMFMVVAGTFEWTSFRIIRKVPLSDAFVLILVSGVTVFTDLAIAVITGVIVSALVFAWEHAKDIEVQLEKETEDYLNYRIIGSLFFGSVRNFHDVFSPQDGPDDVILDFKRTRVCDHSGVEAIHGLTERFRKAGKTLHLRHLSPECSNLLNKMGDLVEVNITQDPNYRIADDLLDN